MARTFVTGGTGFVGRHLVRRLRADGHAVTCLVRRTSDLTPLAGLDVELAYGDVTDAASLPMAVARADVVYHVAGVIKALRAGAMRRVNEGGARNVAAACAARTSPPVLVLVSSIGAAGPSIDGAPRTEPEPPLPVSDYGRSKLAGELAVSELAGPLPITIVRPPIVFGPEDREVLPLFRLAGKGWHVVPTWAQPRFSLVHAADLADLLVRAAAEGERMSDPRDDLAPPGRGVYFAGSVEQPTYAELGRLIGAAMGRSKIRVVHAPAALTWATSAISEVIGRARRQPSLFNIDKAREATAGTWTCSVEKAMRQIGYRPGTLSERLGQTASWYRGQGWL